jgi:hypothetical protein
VKTTPTGENGAQGFDDVLFSPFRSLARSWCCLGVLVGTTLSGAGGVKAQQAERVLAGLYDWRAKTSPDNMTWKSHNARARMLGRPRTYTWRKTTCPLTPVYIGVLCAGLSQVLSRLTRLHTLRLASVEVLSEPPLTAVATSTQQQQRQAQAQAQLGNSSDDAAAAGAATAAAAGTAEAPAGPEVVPAAAAEASNAPAAAAGASGTGAGSSGLAAAARSRRNTRSSGTRIEYLGAAYRVMAAVAGLRSLRSLKLGGLTGWLINPAAELQPLSTATQLTCLHAMDMDVSDDVIHYLVRGLTQLHELDISDNASVGDGVLRHIGAWLPLLRNIDVSGCSSVSEGGIKALKEALPGVDVVCFQSSEEEWL